MFYDTTNFFTHIDTTNDHCDIAQRGMTMAEKKIMIALGIEKAHNEQLKIKDVGVYK